MNPLFNQLFVKISFTVALLSSFCSIVYADASKPSDEVIQDINQQITDISLDTKKIKSELSAIQKNNDVIKKHSSDIQNLSILHKAEQSGLSRAIKKIAPDGGNFEIQADGSIKVIPKDIAYAKELFDKARAKSTYKTETSSPKKITQSSKQLLESLNQANKQGLSALLKKLGAEGGNFELIDDGIKIIPKNTDKAKELAQKTVVASKLVEKKSLKQLSKNLRTLNVRADSWGKVRAVAKAWIKANNKNGLSVGKIRHIKWLYLVSIVTNKGNMDTQLVVRASDGKTVAYTQHTFEVFN